MPGKDYKFEIRSTKSETNPNDLISKSQGVGEGFIPSRCTQPRATPALAGGYKTRPYEIPGLRLFFSTVFVYQSTLFNCILHWHWPGLSETVLHMQEPPQLQK
jgi:hypothetical protein